MFRSSHDDVRDLWVDVALLRRARASSLLAEAAADGLYRQVL